MHPFDWRIAVERSVSWVRAVLIALCATASLAQAQGYPARSVTIVVPLSPGTGLDVVTRTYAEKLSQALGRPFVVDNKPGGSQLVAINALMGSPTDGHALAVLTSGALAINPTMLKKMPYDHLKDFTPISLYVKSPFVLVVNPALPIRSVQELVAYAKERPGKLSYSSPGTSSALHLAFQMMNQQFGLDIVHVPYKSTPQSIADVASGHVQMSFAEAGASQALIRDGKLRALAVSSATRFGTLPDVAPFAEAANVPDFEAVSWHVLVARAGTPREIVARLHDEMQRIMKQPEVRERIANLGLIPFESPSIEGIQRYIQSEAEKWGSVVKKLGLEGTL